MEHYQLAVCGCGPASLSPLLYMEENGQLDELLRLGICVIDESNDIGSGNIGKYHITSNSLGKVFTEIFTNADSPLYAYLKQKDSMKQLDNYLETAAPLTLVGELMNDIGRFLGMRIKKSRTSDLLTSSRVTKIRLLQDKQFEVTIQSLHNPHAIRIITAKHVLFNVGGMQHIPDQFPIEAREDQEIWLSDPFLREMYDERFIERLSVGRPIRIMIVGASHSAFSSLNRLQNRFNLLNHSHCHIDIMTRKPIRLFYRSVEDALEDKYDFDPVQDVCPLSRRVNRFAGLRYDSFKLAKAVIANRFQNVSLQVADKDFSVMSKNQYIRSDIVLICTGYHNKAPQIVDEQDEPLEFEKTKQGTIYTDDNYCPVTKEGRTIHHLYTYGLGTGVRSCVENGGEPSFQAQVHGIWFYQHIIAPRVSSSILERKI